MSIFEEICSLHLEMAKHGTIGSTLLIDVPTYVDLYVDMAALTSTRYQFLPSQKITNVYTSVGKLDIYITKFVNRYGFVPTKPNS